jgi:UDP-N-acetylglucosamine:LPS N-acetylglucosamine transferase
MGMTEQEPLNNEQLTKMVADILQRLIILEEHIAQLEKPRKAKQ